MYELFDVPTPADTHFVGVIFPFAKEGYNYIFSVKDKDMMRDHINIKLPGGGNEDWYEDDFAYEDGLFKTLDLLGFTDKKVQVKIYQNYKKRKRAFEDHPDHKSMLYVLRTMVMESLKNLGYYPMDIAPRVVEFVEKPGHTQYFIEVREFIGSDGELLTNPDLSKRFKSLDSDVVESRIPLLVSDYERLIHSHKTAVKKYLAWKVKNNEYSLAETFGLAQDKNEEAEED